MYFKLWRLGLTFAHHGWWRELYANRIRLLIYLKSRMRHTLFLFFVCFCAFLSFNQSCHCIWLSFSVSVSIHTCIYNTKQVLLLPSLIALHFFSIINVFVFRLICKTWFMNIGCTVLFDNVNLNNSDNVHWMLHTTIFINF